MKQLTSCREKLSARQKDLDRAQQTATSDPSCKEDLTEVGDMEIDSEEETMETQPSVPSQQPPTSSPHTNAPALPKIFNSSAPQTAPSAPSSLQTINSASQVINTTPPIIGSAPQIINSSPQPLSSTMAIFNSAPQVINSTPPMMNSTPSSGVPYYPPPVQGFRPLRPQPPPSQQFSRPLLPPLIQNVPHSIMQAPPGMSPRSAFSQGPRSGGPRGPMRPPHSGGMGGPPRPGLMNVRLHRPLPQPAGVRPPSVVVGPGLMGNAVREQEVHIESKPVLYQTEPELKSSLDDRLQSLVVKKSLGSVLLQEYAESDESGDKPYTPTTTPLPPSPGEADDESVTTPTPQLDMSPVTPEETGPPQFNPANPIMKALYHSPTHSPEEVDCKSDASAPDQLVQSPAPAEGSLLSGVDTGMLQNILKNVQGMIPTSPPPNPPESETPPTLPVPPQQSPTPPPLTTPPSDKPATKPAPGAATNIKITSSLTSLLDEIFPQLSKSLQERKRKQEPVGEGANSLKQTKLETAPRAVTPNSMARPPPPLRPSGPRPNGMFSPRGPSVVMRPAGPGGGRPPGMILRPQGLIRPLGEGLRPQGPPFEGQFRPQGPPRPEGNFRPQGPPRPEGNFRPQGPPRPEGNFRPQGPPRPEGNFRPQGPPRPEGNFRPQGPPRSEGNFGPQGPPRPEGNFRLQGPPRPEGNFRPQGPPRPRMQLVGGTQRPPFGPRGSNSGSPLRPPFTGPNFTRPPYGQGPMRPPVHTPRPPLAGTGMEPNHFPDSVKPQSHDSLQSIPPAGMGMWSGQT